MAVNIVPNKKSGRPNNKYFTYARGLAYISFYTFPFSSFIL